jgi:hypothetical protein
MSDAKKTARIGLVGCTKSKVAHAAPAGDLYLASPLFRGRREYVERTCDRWFVLSAKHGVVSPDQVLEPYDVRLAGAPTRVKREWTDRVLHELKERLGDVRGIEFEIHAGNDYWGFGLVDGLAARGAKVEIPTTGLSQGEQLAFYWGTQSLNQDEPDTSNLYATRNGGGSMGGSYAPLRTYLEQVGESRVLLTFAELEQILGRRLPASAHNHRAWWGNHVGTHSHARSWLEAGWEVAEANLTAERVLFRRR